MVASYDIRLLGQFAVRVDGQPVPAGAWRHKRAAELVKILALADTLENGVDEVAEAGIPVRVPADIAAAVVDSPAAAAMAATLADTLTVFEVA